MTSSNISKELEEMIRAGLPLSRVVSTLREYRRLGVSQHDVQLVLEALRIRTPDELIEDRILEVMDIVSGFCPRDRTVWEE